MCIQRENTGSDTGDSTGSNICDLYLEKLDAIKSMVRRMEEKINMVFGVTPFGSVIVKPNPIPSPIGIVSDSLDNLLSRITNLANRLEKEL